MHTVHGDIYIQMVPMMNMQISPKNLLSSCPQTIDNVRTETRRSVSRENTILDVHADETLAHDIVPLTEHPKYARSKKTATGASKKALFRCHVCRNTATMYYKTCTMRIPHNTREMVIAVCSITSARKSRCINYHFMHGTST